MIKRGREMVRSSMALVLLVALAGCAGLPGGESRESSIAALEANARSALAELTESNSGAKLLSEEAVGILVFPKILKAGLTFGGQYGEGILLKSDEVVSYYNSVSASFGLQAGVQTFGYALMLTNDEALSYIQNSSGWELGLGPSLVIADRGIGKSLTSTTIRSDIYAFVFDQKGLMAGSGLHGTKVSPIFREGVGSAPAK